MKASTLHLALCVALATLHWELATAGCHQAFGIRASKTATDVSVSLSTVPLNVLWNLRYTIKHQAGSELDGRGACYIRCSTASYKNVYNNLISTEHSEVWVSTKDLQKLNDICYWACSHGTESIPWQLRARSSGRIHPVVAHAHAVQPQRVSPPAVHNFFHPARFSFLGSAPRAGPL